MGGGGVVGLWVNDIFGIERGRLYRLFGLERFNLFVNLVRLGCEMERMELIIAWKIADRRRGVR
jgi:hypothetical protein